MVRDGASRLLTMRAELRPRIVAVSLRRGHHFGKTRPLSIRLLSGLGVKCDGQPARPEKT